MRGTCVYCGLPTPHWRDRPQRRYMGRVCVGHQDLPRLDPAFGLASVLAVVQYPALMLEARAPAPKEAAKA